MPNLGSAAIIVTNSPAYLRVKISPQYHQQPLISKLVSDYQLVINITAALLTSSARDDGWFDLEILGDVAQINQALAELHTIGIEALLISPPPISAPPIDTINSSGIKEWRQFDLDRQSQKSQKSLDSSNSEEQNQSRKFQIRIPKEYRDIPVISTLITEYGLTINIAAAILPFASLEDGWFELELRGSTTQLSEGIRYLKDLNLGAYSNPN